MKDILTRYAVLDGSGGWEITRIIAVLSLVDICLDFGFASDFTMKWAIRT